MDLIERYVREVIRFLPREKRADIAAELSSLLGDSLEERSHGQPTGSEVDAAIELLRDLGPPRALAASYRAACEDAPTSASRSRGVRWCVIVAALIAVLVGLTALEPQWLLEPWHRTDVVRAIAGAIVQGSLLLLAAVAFSGGVASLSGRGKAWRPVDLPFPPTAAAGARGKPVNELTIPWRKSP